MFSAVRRLLLCLMLGFYSVSVFSASHAPKIGEIAEQQTRYIASHFPGRMAGSPAELLIADYLMQQFKSWGYQSDIRQFTARYSYTQTNGQQSEQNVTGNSVIAVHPGKEPQQIIIMAHLDTWIPLSDKDRDNNLGGLSLQGLDDNASGLGVMLELAQRLRNTPTRYSIRFIATSGKQLAAAGASSVLLRMSPEEQKNTLMVINLDSLVVGEKLTFISSASTPTAVRKLGRDKAITLANQFAIPAAIQPDILPAKEGDFYREVVLFDNTGIPVLSVSSGRVEKKQYLPQQRAVSKAFPEGTVHHQAARDNMQYLDKWLPGRIKQRTRDSVRIMLPLVKSLAKAEK
ncbi:aminopeptidase [uncultured Cedecea sp.]|uniref:aminopeptidase n=1 Tax=uncultured Cedecea sp. TaxID=988762 RepID=UPI00261AAB79|nr:aminopeptidase [uncultured Cedecea sp.]